MRIDKIELAGQFIVEAAKEYKAATSDIGYAKSILLSGAALNLVSPWLRELKKGTLHGELAQFAAGLDEVGDNERLKAIGAGVNFYRDVYNSLKHSGGNGRKLADDRFLEADLKEEACHLIDCAIIDYNRLICEEGFSDTKKTPELSLLLGSPWPTNRS